MDRNAFSTCVVVFVVHDGYFQYRMYSALHPSKLHEHHPTTRTCHALEEAEGVVSGNPCFGLLSPLCLLPSCHQVESIEAAMLMQRRARKQLRRDGSFRTQAVPVPLPAPLS